VDFRLYADVLARHRRLVLYGLGLAFVLALLSMVRIGLDGVGYRQSEEWASTSRLGVTQQGFPWGRLFAQDAMSLTPAEQAKRLGIPIADPNRFKDLAFLYAELAASDPVRRLMLRSGPIDGEVVARPVIAENGITLPLIDVTATAKSHDEAAALAQRGAGALARYVEQQQRSNKVPPSDRVVLQRLLRAEEATLVTPRPKTIPIVVFLVVATGTIGLAFLLENLRPSVQLVSEPEPVDEPKSQESVAIEPRRRVSLR
jgi:hypothetical protein